VLDIPCGAGYIGHLLSEFPSKVVASDISWEMMKLARPEYDDGKFQGFIQGDLLSSPFKCGAFRCTIVLALMHRLPPNIRREMLSSIAEISSEYVVISFSVDSTLQRLKQKSLALLSSSYLPAPSALTYSQIVEEVRGFSIRRVSYVVPFFSSKILFLLKRE